MDLILLDSPVAADAAKPRLFTLAGLDAVQRLVTWLAADRVPTEIYIELPAEAKERQLALEGLAPRFRELPAVLYILVQVGALSAELLGALENAGLRNVVILGSSGPLLAEVESLRHVREFFDGHPDSRLALGAWLQDGIGHRNYLRTKQYRQAGIFPEVVTSPLFTRDGVALVAAAAAPSELLDGLPGCRLFRNALTIDGDGLVHLCPRGQGGLSLGNLFASQSEDLITAKGASLGSIGCHAACQSCDWRGRFAWPERKAPRIEQLLATGALQPGRVSDALARHEPIAQRDLSAAGDEVIAGDLAAFDERLKAWRDSMTEVDGVEK